MVIHNTVIRKLINAIIVICFIVAGLSIINIYIDIDNNTNNDGLIGNVFIFIVTQHGVE